MQPEIERCRQEIDCIETQLRAGHQDLQGLGRALMDWHAELRLLQPGEPEHRVEAMQ